DVRFENQTAVLNPNPNAVSFNSSQRPRAKSGRVALQRTAAAFFKGHQRVNREHLLEIVHSRQSQIGNLRFDRRRLGNFKKMLGTNEARLRAAVRKIFPEIFDDAFFAANQVSVLRIASDASEGD